MRQMKTLRQSILAATAVGSIMFAAVSVHADTLTFTPEPGGTTLNIHNGNDTSLTSGLDIDQFNWRAVRDDLSTDSWFIRINPDNSFSETFTFVLSSVQGAGLAFMGDTSGSVGADANFPIPVNNGPFNSYVTMQATLSGDINSISAAGVPGSQVESLDLTYSGADFTMFFHPDGDSASGNAIEIAEFGGDPLEPGESGFSIEGTGNQTTLEWNLFLKDALAGVFLLDGVDLASAIIDDDNDGLGDVKEEFILKTTTQIIDVIEGPDSELGGAGSRVLQVGFVDNGESTFDARIPEPGTLSLFGIGLLGMGVLAHRRRQRLTVS